MRRIKPQTAPQPTPDTHGRPWHELALLVGYLVICLLSILTVLLPTTENNEAAPEHKAQATTTTTTTTTTNRANSADSADSTDAKTTK